MKETMNVDALKSYKLAREDAGLFMDRIYSLALVVSAAARSPDAQSDFDVKAVGVVNEVIAEDIKKIESIFDQYLNELRETEG